jgi:hypothetical protein
VHRSEGPQGWCEHGRQGRQSPEPHGNGGLCANAGVRTLLRTGADHAIAEAAPIRLSIVRREITGASLPHADKSCLPHLA